MLSRAAVFTMTARSGAALRSAAGVLHAGVEGQIGRFRQVIGDALRSHSDAAQAIEAAIAVAVLNHMLNPGRPISVRIA